MDELLSKILSRLDDLVKKLPPAVRTPAKFLIKNAPGVGTFITVLGAVKTLFTNLAAAIAKGIKPATEAIKAFHQSFLNSFASAKDLKAMLVEVDKGLKDNATQKFFDENVRGPDGQPVSSDEERHKTAKDFERLSKEQAELGQRLEQTRAAGEELSATSGALNEALKLLEVAIGGEDGLLAAFLELDAALQSANLPAELEALADAVATAAARIANAVGSTPKKTAPKGRMAEAASGGTVQPGQPVLVGERGPEIFVPSGPGTIVNAFDASADPSALGINASSGANSQIVVALQDLEETINELDQTIQSAENGGINGIAASGGSSRARRASGGRGGASALDQVEDFLNTVESTVQAFENIDRTMSDFRNQAKDDFEGIARSGGEAFQSILGSVQSLVTNLIGGKAGRIIGIIGNVARIFAGFAGGGDLQPGVPALVGERGPELIVPRVPLSVKNNSDSRRLLGGGTPVVVNQTVNMSADVKNTIRAEVLSAMPIAAQLATQAVTAQLQGRRF
jgi:hypothetical protein